jgi:beta-lactamase regulating signal transducer with metallopeptidase domain/Flp pilus assembly secretin CpaC
LILPPTFASPTSATWWLWQNKTEIKTPAIKNYSVTYDNAPQTDFVPQTIPLTAPLPPKLNVAGCLLLASIFISVILFLWLVIRWWQIARKIRGAVESEKFSDALAEARLLANSNSRARLKIVEAQMSPAVCGLLRPVILLPRALAEKLSAEQLRAVLLHEIFHLRRKDVWVNCAQALLQIFYWWHPLLWFANARIRRVREEAVDDAVMLALRDEAETYAPTLLEVAKLALRRPLMSLGLVGIMESRSALRQRIERLLDFRAPEKTGLTFLSICGIFIFSAVALPMGEGPSASDENNLPATTRSVTSLSWTPTNSPVILIQAEIYRMRQADFEKLVSDPAFVGTRPDKVKNFQQFKRLLKSSGFQPISRPRILTRNSLPAQFYVGNETNSIEFECRPFVTNGLIDLANRIKIVSTMENVTTTNQLVDQISLESGGGRVFSIKSADHLTESNLVVVTIGAEIVTNQSQFQQRLQKIIKRADGTNSAASNSTNLFSTQTFKVPPQIHIKARFLEVPKGTLDAFSKTIGGTNKISGELTGILTPENFKTILRNLETRTNVEILAEPEGVTTSGRQMQMRATQIVTVITNFAFYEPFTNQNGKIFNNGITPTMSRLETGSIVDTTAYVLSDGYTINLNATASLTKFLGYAKIPKNLQTRWVTNSAGLPIGLPQIRPMMQTGSQSERVNMLDGQTLILGGISMTNFITTKDKVPLLGDLPLMGRLFRSESESATTNQILIFITASIVDPAGKRIHSDADLPPAQKGIPPADSSVNFYF